MDWEILRTLCIKEQWCTRATNREYEKLLGMTEHDYIDTDIIVEMANFIIAHSDENQCDTDFESVCFKLLSKCQTFIRKKSANGTGESKPVVEIMPTDQVVHINTQSARLKPQMRFFKNAV